MFDIVSTRYRKISWIAGMKMFKSTYIVIMQLILPAVCLLTSTHTLLIYVTLRIVNNSENARDSLNGGTMDN